MFKYFFSMKALFVVSALIVYDLEQAKKYQLIEAFEAIWQKLISRVKMQITSFGKTIVMQLITLVIIQYFLMLIFKHDIFLD